MKPFVMIAVMACFPVLLVAVVIDLLNGTEYVQDALSELIG